MEEQEHMASVASQDASAPSVPNAHTPGPWEARGGTIFRQGQQALSVAIITKWQPEHKANARLIAAAPDLFELLREVRDACFYGEDDGIGVTEEPTIDADLFDRICTALAKARGQ